MQSALGDKAGNFIKMKEKVQEITVNSSVDLISFPDGEYITKMAEVAKSTMYLLSTDCRRNSNF